MIAGKCSLCLLLVPFRETSQSLCLLKSFCSLYFPGRHVRISEDRVGTRRASHEGVYTMSPVDCIVPEHSDA